MPLRRWCSAFSRTAPSSQRQLLQQGAPHTRCQRRRRAASVSRSMRCAAALPQFTRLSGAAARSRGSQCAALHATQHTRLTPSAPLPPYGTRRHLAGRRSLLLLATASLHPRLRATPACRRADSPCCASESKRRHCGSHGATTALRQSAARATPRFAARRLLHDAPLCSRATPASMPRQRHGARRPRQPRARRFRRAARRSGALVHPCASTSQASTLTPLNTPLK